MSDDPRDDDYFNDDEEQEFNPPPPQYTDDDIPLFFGDEDDPFEPDVVDEHFWLDYDPNIVVPDEGDEPEWKIPFDDPIGDPTEAGNGVLVDLSNIPPEYERRAVLFNSLEEALEYLRRGGIIRFGIPFDAGGGLVGVAVIRDSKGVVTELPTNPNDDEPADDDEDGEIPF